MTIDELRTALTRAGHNADRFLSKVRLTATGCLEWTAPLNKQGYSQYGHKRRTRTAHRWLYEAVHGPVPHELQLDHLCRNRACVNPTHLEPVTQRENIMRGETIAAHNHAKTHCKHGHAFTPDNTLTRRTRPGTRECRTCRQARRHNPDYQKHWRAKHPDYQKHWRAKHPDYQKHWRAKRANDGTLTANADPA